MRLPVALARRPAFAARSGIVTFPLANAEEAYSRMMSGKARFRVVLDVR